MSVFKVIDDAVAKIKEIESTKKRITVALFPVKEMDLGELKSNDLLESRFSFPVELKKLNCRVGGIDSGFAGMNFSTLDLVLVKGAGVVFSFENGLLVSSKGFPGRMDFPEPTILDNFLERDEFNCTMSLLRLKKEISLAREIAEKEIPGFVFLDGSIVPQFADKPRENSKVAPLYRAVLLEYQMLYEACEKNNCVLIGTVEDSRGSKIRTIIQKEILSKKPICSPALIDNAFDYFLLDGLLGLNERTFVFPYASKKEKHPILHDFPERWTEEIHVFYLRPSLLDRPLRVEFLSPKDELKVITKKVAETVLALSSMHREYAYPSVLIDADLRAKLKPEEISIVFDKIRDKVNPNSFMFQRRDRRPF